VNRGLFTSNVAEEQGSLLCVKPLVYTRPDSEVVIGSSCKGFTYYKLRVDRARVQRIYVVVFYCCCFLFGALRAAMRKLVGDPISKVLISMLLLYTTYVITVNIAMLNLVEVTNVPNRTQPL
jgi:hypothetical protein